MIHVHPTLRRLGAALALGSIWLLGSAAQAHNVWLAPDAKGGHLVQFGGHNGQLQAFDPAKLCSVKALDARGREVEAKVTQSAQGVHVQPSPKATLISVELNNGYFSGGETGAMRNVPMTENPGATRGVFALKFHKTVIRWNALTQRELGKVFELLAQQGHTPHAGEWLTLKVQLKGKPLAGARVSLGEGSEPVISDADGLVKIKVKEGSNHIQAIFREPVQGNPKTTQNSYEALFSFAAH